MAALFVVAVTLGLDSARASAVLALQPGSSGRAVRLALAFGACDGAASFVGLTAGAPFVAAVEPRVRLVGALLLGLYGLWLALEPLERPSRTLVWIPVALSLDNLGAGIALAGAGPAWAVAALLGAASCMLAALAFWAGGLVRTRVPPFAPQLGGVALLAIAASQATGVG